MNQEVKNKVDKIWQYFWEGGISNPSDIVKQLTYLIFIHDLDSQDNKKIKEDRILKTGYVSPFVGEMDVFDEKTKKIKKIKKKELKWSLFKDLPSDEMFDLVKNGAFPFIKDLHGSKETAFSKYIQDASFDIKTPLLLEKAVTGLEELYKYCDSIEEMDVQGDIYEYLLSKMSSAGELGQFRTPRHIIEMMVRLMDPKPTDTICDPACGTAGFLVETSKYLNKVYEKEIYFNEANKSHYYTEMFNGFDIDSSMMMIGAMNLIKHGINTPNLNRQDSLSKNENVDENKYSLILANPPFKGTIDEERIAPELLRVCKTKRSELLFIALILRMLKVGGRCACIVPNGVVSNTNEKAYITLRKELVENQKLEAVISMPSGVFKPYADVSTAILIFTKTNHGGTKKVWFYEMRADGFTLNDKRLETKENDIPDIINRFSNIQNEEIRERSEQSFLIPKEDIVNQDYDLTLEKYKITLHEKKIFKPLNELIDEIEQMNRQILEEIMDLKSNY